MDLTGPQAAAYEAAHAAIKAALASCTSADPPCSSCVAEFVVDAVWPLAWEAARKEFEFDPDVVVSAAERDVRHYRLVPIEEG